MKQERRLVLMVLRQGRAISTYPTVVNAARMWRQAGWEVDIITQTEPDVPDLFRNFVKFESRRFPLQMLQVVHQTLKTRPAVVIAYEPIDAELCTLLPKLHEAKYVYHNIELRYPGKPYHAIHQHLERLFYRDCDTIICQDPLRMSELQKLLGLPKTGALEMLVPNTYMRPSSPSRSLFWENKYNLRPGTNVLLYSGAIQRRKLPIEVIDSILDNLPINWSFALLGWSVDQYVESMQSTHHNQIESNRLIFCIETLSEEKYLEAVFGAHAGLVWYATSKECDENEFNIGLSSGKFWRFITAGIPVLSNSTPGLSEYINENNLGHIVTNHQSIAATLFDKMPTILTNSTFFYEHHYNIQMMAR